MYIIERGGKQSRPLSAEQLRQYAKVGKLQASDLILHKDGRQLGLVSALPQLCDLLTSSERRTHQNPAPRAPVSCPATVPDEKIDLTPKSAGTHSVLGQIWSGGKMAAAIGSLAGFIGDFLEPLAPINGVLFLGALATSIVLGLSWLAMDHGKRGDLDRWFPQQLFIFTSFLLVAFGGWFLLQRLHPEQDRGVLGGHFSVVAEAQDAILRLKEDVAAIRQDTAAIRDSIAQATAGSMKLDSSYDSVAFHRDYQDRFVKDGGRWETLVTQYQQRVATEPSNAMFHYLLSRAYNNNSQYALARETARNGLRADPTFMWNRRYLLYYSVPDAFDENWVLQEEAVHYSLTPEDLVHFASDDPAVVMQAMTRLRERFEADPVLYADLTDRDLCWHLSRALRRWTYPTSQPFKRLIGLGNRSNAGQFELLILDLRTGIEAIRLIPEIEDHVVIEDGKRTEMNKQAMLRTSISMPPIAVKIRLRPLRSGISGTDVSARTFQIAAHCSTPHPAVLEGFFRGGAAIDPSRRMGLSNCEADLKHLFEPDGFWVYVFSHAAPWIESEEVLFVATWNLESPGASEVTSDWVQITAPSVGGGDLEQRIGPAP